MKDLRHERPEGHLASFFHGAKIGVVGPRIRQEHTSQDHGSLDEDFLGEAWAAKGTKIGHLPQEPELDPELDVRGNIDEAVRETRNLLAEFEIGQREIRRADDG